MVMLLSLLRTATSLTQIHQIHAQTLIHGLPLQTHLIPKLIDLHSIDYARFVLDQTPSPTDFSWNSLIRAYTVHGSPQNSLFLYLKMLRSSTKPSNFTFPFVLKACSTLGSVLEDMYCKCFRLDSARNFWDDMGFRDEVSWNSIISGYVQWGQVEKARDLFEEMPMRRNVLMRSNPMQQQWCVYCLPVQLSVIMRLEDMYSKCGDVEKAWRIFDGVSCKNLPSWNAIITGCVQGGLLEEAIDLYRHMKAQSVKPNEITLVNVLSACAGLGALELGREVHLYLGRNGLDLNVILATALVDMYAKCGKIDDACLIFVKTSEKDVALWNAMILGLAYHGDGRDSLAVFSQMVRAGVQPNDVTFIGVLSACNHSGLVEEGRVQFSSMADKHGLSPKLEHYACMVDLLGRAGISKKHMNCETIMASQDPNIGFCILLSNIYASSGRWKDVARVRRQVKEKRIKKPSGCSWVEVDGVVHRFVVEDTTHLKSGEIYGAYEILVNHLKAEGLVLPKGNEVSTLDCSCSITDFGGHTHKKHKWPGFMVMQSNSIVPCLWIDG
ncbi:Pentatricopeptide repeat-containing protein [Vitis vinifera]|uniref:Pentatricopeptide repeat-containing protein n=1 Tax=Vitis vinifera TaxID=29760 RepID=A0A438EW23_VITVI|nr:Pentatricopeptide repeat-containing protein [Vitis vinifera]